MEDRAQFELNYLVLPNYAYKDNRLTLTAIKVYAFIHTYTNPFFFSNAHLAGMFNCSERGIEDAVALLKELKYIKTEYKVKSGGGKIRLAIDCGSEPQLNVVGNENSEATNHATLPGKEEKENNIKGEEPIGNDLDLITPVRKKDRVYKIGGGYQRPQPTYQKNNFMEKKKGGVDFSDLP